MPRKKNANTQYWNQAVEDAVCAYNSTDDHSEKEKHFRVIYPALSKVAEVMYHKVKFSYSDDDMQDTMAECVIHLTENLPKFKCGQGTKSFSYMTVCARFFYIQLSNKNYRYFQRVIPISSMVENWDVENADREDEIKSENAQLFYDFIDYCNYNFEEMFTTKYKPYAKIILDSLANFEDIEDFRNRKVLQFIYKRGNVSETKKTNINRTLNVMISHLTLFKKSWYDGKESLELCRKTTLTPEEKQIIKNTIIPGKKNNGTTSLARRFGVDIKVINDYIKAYITS